MPDGTNIDSWQERERQRVARLDAHHRRPPMPYYRSATRGFCRWCGEAIEKADGSINLRRSWHSDCVRAFLIATDSGVQRSVAWQQDRGICRGCGRDLAKLLVPYRAHYRDLPEGHALVLHGPRGADHTAERVRADGPCCLVMWRLAPWEADHIVPLWTVDKTAPDALRFWGPENLQLQCSRCHKRKTAAEAGMRAKEKRQRSKMGMGAACLVKRRKRKIPSRPFPKASRPLRNPR